MISNFSPEVIKEIKCYVYRLLDPRNGETFYVGKGKGNRVFDHIKGELTFEGDEDAISEKIGRIRAIRRDNLDVIHIIHRHGLESDTALEVEAALIDAYSGLANEIGGGGSRDRGPMNVQQIENSYNAEIIEEITEKCIIIKIKQSTLDRYSGDSSEAIYEATRAAWRLNITNAEKADYVLSVLQGVAQAVYTDMQWSRAENGKRWEFEGKEAPENIKDKYIGKRIPSKYMKRGAQSPFFYVNIP